MTASPRPAPCIGFRRERKQNGEQFLAATTVDDVVLPKGSRLVLRKLHDGSLPGPEYVLVCVPAPLLPKAERDAAVRDDLTGSAHRPGFQAAPGTVPFATDGEAKS